ncbi:MAG TPA: NPCBM/NEW2 domain-containing protein [Verrucomicrobiae bacterium]|nr:NPCBM/NEW2 domain-containing protein [Verrucomicrobiae bacterium]
MRIQQHCPLAPVRFGRIVSALCATLLALAGTERAGAWGEPHATITRAALATLPDWQRQRLGEEWEALGSHHCLIPDRVHTEKENARFAMMDSRPGVVYLVNLHLPATQPENFEVLRYFMGKGVAAMRVGDLRDAARYAGTLAHVLEDWTCPAHCVPGDNMFTLFKQFLPPPEPWRYALLHGPVENGTLKVTIGSREPRLLADSVDEAAFRLLQRANEGTAAARAQVIPIIQGLYSGDTNAVVTAQTSAAVCGAGIVADALHTMFCLGAETPLAAVPKTLDLSSCIPLEATNLAFPQGAFFSRPYWGHAQRGVILRDGTNAIPLSLLVEEQGGITEKQFATGIGTGTRSALSYLVPAGVYDRFAVLAGLQAGLGASGNVQFSVLGNGKVLCAATVTGRQPARRLECPIAGVTNLQLVATSGGGDGKGNFAVWAEPQLIKADKGP